MMHMFCGKIELVGHGQAKYVLIQNSKCAKMAVHRGGLVRLKYNPQNIQYDNRTALNIVATGILFHRLRCLSPPTEMLLFHAKIIMYRRSVIHAQEPRQDLPC